MLFEFSTASRIVFGPGKMAELGAIAGSAGRRALVVTGSSRDRAAALCALLEGRGVSCVVFPVSGEPSIDTVDEAAGLARAERCEMVIGFGGGSALDAGKAAAAMMTNGGDVLDYLEVVGKGAPLAHRPAPYFAVPTTAGTGSEVTKNAVLFSPAHGVKVSLRSNKMLPVVALVDPLLTHTLPPAATASTGLDALTQLLEPFVGAGANPLTDGVCRDGIARVARALPKAYRNGGDARAREDMALGSLMGGIALANAGLGAAHGFAGPLGGMYAAPHGALCARLLPPVMRVNVRALEARDPDGEALRRYGEAARLLTGRDGAAPGDASAAVAALCEEMGIPPLSCYGVKSRDIPLLVERARNASSMKGNPVALTEEELTEILEQAL